MVWCLQRGGLPLLIGLVIALITMAALPQPSFAAVIQSASVSGPVWREGDTAPWAANGSQPDQWAPIETLDTHFRGVFWMQVPVSLDTSVIGVQVVAVIETNLSIDVYWDGRFLGNNSNSPLGRRPRPYRSVELTLPADWTLADRGTLTMYAESEDLPAGEQLFVNIGVRPAASHLQAERVLDWIDGAAILLSIFMAVSFGILGALRRGRLDLLLITAICSSVSAVILLDYHGRAYYLFSNQVDLANVGLFLFSLAILFLVPTLYAVRLRIKNRLFWGGLTLTAVLLGIPNWPILTLDQDSRMFLAMTLVLSAMAAAAPQRRLEKLGYTAGALALAVVIVLDPDLLRRFLAALTMLLSIWLLLDLFMTESNARRADARSARLQTELIKRNIQPHFILNSLTVAIELQETDRQLARRFIEALAEEYRALSDLIDKPSVTLLQELNLSRKHLEMMSYRMGRQFLLKYQGDSPEQPFPPGILHTLVENALSHNRYQVPMIEFGVRFTRSRDVSSLTLRVPIGEDQSRSGTSTGSGTAYVKARLEDFSPGAWTLSAVRDGDQWVTSITFKES